MIFWCQYFSSLIFCPFHLPSGRLLAILLHSVGDSSYIGSVALWWFGTGDMSAQLSGGKWVCYKPPNGRYMRKSWRGTLMQNTTIITPNFACILVEKITWFNNRNFIPAAPLFKWLNQTGQKHKESLEYPRSHCFCLEYFTWNCVDRDSSVGIAIGCRLDGLGILSRWGARFSAPVQTGPGAHPAFCTMGTGSFPGVKSGRGVTLTPCPLVVPLVMKE